MIAFEVDMVVGAMTRGARITTKTISGHNAFIGDLMYNANIKKYMKCSIKRDSIVLSKPLLQITLRECTFLINKKLDDIQTAIGNPKAVIF